MGKTFERPSYCMRVTAERVSDTASHLAQLTLTTDNERMKTTINQLISLISPAPPGVCFYLHFCNVFIDIYLTWYKKATLLFGPALGDEVTYTSWNQQCTVHLPSKQHSLLVVISGWHKAAVCEWLCYHSYTLLESSYRWKGKSCWAVTTVTTWWGERGILEYVVILLYPKTGYPLNTFEYTMDAWVQKYARVWAFCVKISQQCCSHDLSRCMYCECSGDDDAATAYTVGVSSQFRQMYD